MRELPTIRGIWEGGLGRLFGDNKPHGRVTYEPNWTLTTTGQVQGAGDKGPYRHWWDSNHRASEIEVPNIKTISIDRSIDQDAAQCTITLYNQWHDDNGVTPGSFDALGNAGYLGPTYGDTDTSDAWGQTPNSWNNVLIPNALIRTYQGYGGYTDGVPDGIDTAIAAGNLAITGTWLVDSVTTGTNGLISLKCRDMGKLLIEQMIYTPLVPERYYPLKYYRYVFEPVPDTVGAPGIPEVPGTETDPVSGGLGAAAITHFDSSVERWFGRQGLIPPREEDFAEYQDYLDASIEFANEFAANGSVTPINSVHGTVASSVWDGSEDTYSMSGSSVHWNRVWAREWWEGSVGGVDINQIYISPYGVPDNGAYSVWISIMEGGLWQGVNRISWDDDDGNGISDALEAVQDAPQTNVDIPFVGFTSVQNLNDGVGQWHKLDRIYAADRIRITMTPNWNSNLGGAFNYRAALRRVSARLVNEDPAARFGPIPRFLGSVVTRGDAIAALYVFVGSPPPPLGDSGSAFDDVVQARHIPAANWALTNGITTGTQLVPPLFSPDRAITRAEFVTFLHRALGSPAIGTPHGFLDVYPQRIEGSWQDAPVRWAKSTEVTTGTDPAGTLFSPDAALRPEDGETFFERYATVIVSIPSFWNVATADQTVIIPSPPIVHDGNILDWIDPVVDLLLWAGFLELDSNQALMHGIVEYSGVWPVRDLNEDVFDKKSVMDGINTVKEVLGYVFFLNEEGAVHFHTPNWWSSGNTDDNGDRVTYIPEIRDEVVLTDYTSQWTDDTIRSEIIIGSSLIEQDEQGANSTVQNVNLNPNILTDTDLLHGMTRPAIWINEVWTDRSEQLLMAALIGLHLLFQSKKGSVTCLANPEIQLNDQVRIFERVSSEAYIHYVRSVRTTMDLDSGSYLMTLETNWLGEFDNWAFNRDILAALYGERLEPSKNQFNYDGGLAGWATFGDSPIGGSGFTTGPTAQSGTSTTGGSQIPVADPGGDGAGLNGSRNLFMAPFSGSVS